MTINDLPIKEGINIAGSICSIIAVLMTFSFSFNVLQWIIIISGLIFAVCIFGLMLSIASYIPKSWRCIGSFVKNPFGLFIYWSLIVILCIFAATFLGFIFGCIVHLLFIMLKYMLLSLPSAFRI